MRSIIPFVLAAPMTVVGIRLFESPASIPASVPARCRGALSQNITCDTLIPPHLAANGQFLVGAGAVSFCSDSCRNSLNTFRTQATSNCGQTFYSLYANSSYTQSGQALAEGLVWANNLLCIRDEEGYCLAALDAGNKTACSDCSLRYGAQMLSSDYGRVRYPEREFSSLLSSCSVPASSYPWTHTTSPPNPTSPTASPTDSPTPQPCNGEIYTVAEGDTCQSIAEANSIAIDRLIVTNSLDRNCDALSPGRSLCIADPCPLLTIEQGQTCNDIVNGRDFNVIQLQSWNPVLGSMCNTNIRPNLDALAGRSICIGPPGGKDFVTPPQTTPTPTWSPTMFTESWRPGVVETSPSIGTITSTGLFDPSYSATPTTNTWDGALESALAERRRYCWITDDDLDYGYFHEEYPQGCQNLYITYCEPDPSAPVPPSPSRIPAQCTPDRSEYNLPMPVTTPRPYQDGMTRGCNAFHRVGVGEICDTITEQHEISFDDLFRWNPAIGGSCQNLQANVYICIDYDPRLESV